MSQENVEIVRRGYEAFNRGDREHMVADVAPTFEYVGTATVPGFPGSLQGPQGWVKAVSWLSDEFENAHVEIHELIDAEDKVLASLTLQGRGKQSGADTSWQMWQVWTVQDGKLMHGKGFTSRDEALEAVELSE